MQNNPIYKKFEESTASYFIEQVSGLTYAQICELVEETKVSITFIKNMKKCRITELQRDIDEAFEKNVRDVLDDNLPGWKDTTAGKDIESRLAKAVVKPVEEIR